MGHEYWMADGERIGYHGGNAKGDLFGSLRHDNTEQVEGSFAAHCWHFHSHLLDLVVGDGDVKNPCLPACRFRDGHFEGPKVIAEHRGSFHTQQVHVHPCVHAADTKILSTGDPQGYGQVNIVEVPAWDALPDRSSVPGSPSRSWSRMRFASACVAPSAGDARRGGFIALMRE